MKDDNATYLFQGENRNLRNSETFWTSLFAIQIFLASRKKPLEIPVHIYKDPGKSGGGWEFEKFGTPLTIPQNIEFSNIIVEGKIPIYDPRFDKTITDKRKYENLEPDLMIIGENSFTVIETKTIGASISDKEILYSKFCKELKEKRGWVSEAYLLISAGHERYKEILMLANEKWKGPKKLILWEKFFEAIENLSKSENPTEKPIISNLFPDLAKYYSNPNLFRANSED